MNRIKDRRIFYVSRIRYQNILFRRSKEARNSQYRKNNNSYFRLWVDLDKKNPSSFRAWSLVTWDSESRSLKTVLTPPWNRREFHFICCVSQLGILSFDRLLKIEFSIVLQNSIHSQWGSYCFIWPRLEAVSGTGWFKSLIFQQNYSSSWRRIYLFITGSGLS